MKTAKAPVINLSTGSGTKPRRAGDASKRAEAPRCPSRIRIQRAYAEPGLHDGYRVLVDRFWPRGRRKEELQLDEWARDLAPDAELIHWFGHDVARWNDFRSRYKAELAGREQRLRALLAAAAGRAITLVYGASDEQHNQAVVLREVLTALDRR